MTTLHQACDQLRAQAAIHAPGARYVFHLPRRKKSYAGFGMHREIRYLADGVEVTDRAGKMERHALPDQPLAALKGFLDPQFPAFLLVSSDLGRAARDPELPLLVCIQPEFEAEFSSFGPSRTPAAPLKAAPAEGWVTQSDDQFLERLAAAIQILRQGPFGKMIITRPYQRPVRGNDPLALFEMFAASEPSAAASHYLRIGPEMHSLGCSPENIFEVEGGRLVFDVVAATRGISPDPDVDRRWLEALKSDPKEQREHLMAFDRYEARIRTLVEPASLSIDHKLQVLELGNVRHLYSRMSGRLRAGRDWSGMLEDSYPALISYPAELQALSDVAHEPNRFYGGIVGRIAPGGADAAFFLNLRAALVHRRELYTLGGVGVIAESEPDKELLEVKNKLSGLMKAVAAWEQHP